MFSNTVKKNIYFDMHKAIKTYVILGDNDYDNSRLFTCIIFIKSIVHVNDRL